MAALHMSVSLRQAAFFSHRALLPAIVVSKTGCQRFLSASVGSVQSPHDKPAFRLGDVAANNTAEAATSDSTPVEEPPSKKRGRPKTKPDPPKKKRVKGTVR